MVDKKFLVSKHTWNGHGGPRGLVTHLWDRTFKAVKDEIEKGGQGMYRITFERLGDVTIGHEDHRSGLDAIS
jgi:hypothetical protein